MPQFADRWTKSSSPTIGEKIKETIRPPGPLKPRLDAAMRQINVQISKLDSVTARLGSKDDAIFKRIVSAIQRHDMPHASMFANELAEIRKMNKMATQAKIALEQIVLRLNTVQELGDVVVTLTPAMAVIRNVKSGIGSVLPEADHEMGEISGLLSSILVEAGQVESRTLNFEAANEDAERIISEASIVAEERIKDKFPELPMGDKLPTTEGLE
ncbi:MAG: Snf7 family protein [Candidatus Methylarchaceae archaeon HK02M1]|nr:Snf7 family protein [Candidatus Methylarchaceae archaeon HK01M]MCP8311540.1 Snf7 family protein [Candidatus Methylarchaceae archaeon HK02M1]